MSGQDCATALAVCNASLANVTALFESGAGSAADVEDPCARESVENYGFELHIAAVFIVLCASGLGASIPLLAKHGCLNIGAYPICLGKCAGTGVVLAVGFIHMLQPAALSLQGPCMPDEFKTHYTAYAFLYALLASLAMQFVDLLLTRHVLRQQLTDIDAVPSSGGPCEVVVAGEPSEAGTSTSRAAPVVAQGDATAAAWSGEPPPETPISTTAHRSSSHLGHSHSHPTLMLGKEGMTVRKLVSAYLLELGVTTHSVIIGLAVGVSDEATMKTLLTALCFHQFFEGVALGSRLEEANLRSWCNELFLVAIFAVSSPVGMAIGVGIVSNLNPNSETFNMLSGTFDGWCAGILLYLGYSLLLKDFPEDLEQHCARRPREVTRMMGMFAALWLGAGLMAFLGRYL